MQNAKSKSGGVGARYLINRRERSPHPPFPIQKSLPMGDFKFGFIGELWFAVGEAISLPQICENQR